MLHLRIITALIFAPALLYCIYLGGNTLKIACIVLAALMTWEFQRMFAQKLGTAGRVSVYFGAAIACAEALGLFAPAWAGLSLPLITILVVVIALFNPEPIEEAGARMGMALFGSLYCGALIVQLSTLRNLEHGIGLAVMALFCTWGSDTGGYFAGRVFGKHKLYPKVSPKKTIEGAIGGLLAAVAVAFIVRHLFDVQFNAPVIVALGLLGGTAGPVGDLVESLLKRSAGVKDSSGLIPGHGGVLDRFDGVMFVAPALLLLIKLIG